MIICDQDTNTHNDPPGYSYYSPCDQYSTLWAGWLYSCLRQQLREQGELVVTVDGKPFAVMIDLGGSENMDEIMLLISRLRAQMAARSIRSQARRNGLDQMNGEQVDALIQKTRQKKAR